MAPIYDTVAPIQQNGYKYLYKLHRTQQDGDYLVKTIQGVFIATSKPCSELLL